MTIRTFNEGDRVELLQSTMMDKKGAVGVVRSKYTPMHCTGAWYILIRWDGNEHDTSYPYPTGGLIAHAGG